MKQRFYALDFLRAFMMFLGVLYHGWQNLNPHLPLIDEIWNSKIMSFSSSVVHTFRMPLFFCLSGFFSALLLERKGVKKFIINRAKRILLPFIASFFTLSLLCELLTRTIGYQKLNYPFFDALRSGFSLQNFAILNLPPLHLWFIYYLGWFIVIAILLIGVFKMVLPRFTLPIFNSQKLHNWVLQGLVVFSLLPTYLIFAKSYDGPYVSASLGIRFTYFIYYFYFFAFGWIVYQRPFKLDLKEKTGWWLLIIALSLTFLKTELRILLLGTSLSILPICAYCLSIWCYMISLVGFSQRYFNKKSYFLQYASDSSYWVYLVHYPILLILKFLFLYNNSLLLFVILIGFTFWLSLVSYNYLVRPTFLGQLLNGKRHKVYPFTDFRLLRSFFSKLNLEKRSWTNSLVSKYRSYFW